MAPLGFNGDPDAWITTAELAARMGYASVHGFYRDARRRAASGFPAPRRRGLWRLGDLQDWDRRGGWGALAAPAGHPGDGGQRAQIREAVLVQLDRFRRRA